VIIKAIGVRGRFTGCLRYLLDKVRSVDPEILDTTLPGGTASVMAAHAAFDASRRPDIEQPCYHAVIAWDEGDHPTDADMEAVSGRLLTALAIDPEKHGYAIIAHRDTPHAHCHLVVNRVGVDGQVWDRHNDARHMQVFRRQIEQEYGLVRADGRGAVAQVAQTLKPNGEGAGARSLTSAKHDVHTAIASAVRHCDGTFAGFVTTCQEEKRIFPALSFNAQGGFNGGSFTLLNVDGSVAMQAGTGDGPEKPFIFKGSELKWPKSTLEAALLARRHQLASPGGSPAAEPHHAAQAGHDLQQSLAALPPPATARPVAPQRTRQKKSAPFYRQLFRRHPRLRRWRTQVSWKDMFGVASAMDQRMHQDLAIVSSAWDLEHPLPKSPLRHPQR